MASRGRIGAVKVGAIAEVCWEAAVLFDPKDPAAIVNGAREALALADELYDVDIAPRRALHVGEMARERDAVDGPWYPNRACKILDVRVSIFLLYAHPRRQRRFGGLHARELVRALGRVGTHDYRVFLPTIAPDVEGLPAEIATEYRASRTTAGRMLAMSAATLRPGPIRRRFATADAIHFPLTVMVPPVTTPPAVTTVLDVQHELLPEFFSRAERFYRKRVYGWTVRNSRLIVTISASCGWNHCGAPRRSRGASTPDPLWNRSPTLHSRARAATRVPLLSGARMAAQESPTPFRGVHCLRSATPGSSSC